MAITPAPLAPPALFQADRTPTANDDCATIGANVANNASLPFVVRSDGNWETT